MTFKRSLREISWLLASSVLLAAPAALAQAPAPQASTCVPATPGAPALTPTAIGEQAARAPSTAVPRPPETVAIPGVVAGGLRWTKVWQGAGNSADGLLPAKAGGVLVAQEDFDTVLRIDDQGRTSVMLSDAKGIGSLSMDREGRLYGAHRTERPGSTKPDIATIVNAVTELSPQRRTISDKWADGSILTTRPNDLAADGLGGAYFTSGCLYYASSKGAVVLADDLHTNGIIFSRDDKVLYVTNGASVVAFDIVGAGVVANRREFATLPAGGTGDGLAIDAQGRLYVTSQPGVQVFNQSGASLGLIPTPRAVISLVFGGPEWCNRAMKTRRRQQTAATLYALPMIADGFKGRAK